MKFYGRAPFTLSRTPGLILLILGTLLALAPAVQAQNVFQVDATSDGEDANPGDGVCLSVDGDCSLRAAIEEANALPNGASPDVIEFTNVPVSRGVAVIDVIDYGLPDIRETVVIDGTTASGEVILDGINNIANAWTLPNGLKLGSGSDGSKIRGLNIVNLGRNEGALAAGQTHTFRFDGSGLASGVYLLRVDGGALVETRRLMLIK